MNHAGVTASGLASSEAGLFFVFGEYSDVDEIGILNSIELLILEMYLDGWKC